MTKLRFVVAALALVAASACAHHPAPDAPAPDVAGLEARARALLDAYRDADVAALDALIAPSYVHANGGAAPIGREAWLDWSRTRAAHYATGAWRLDRYEVSELAVSVSGPAGVVTGRVRSAGVRDGVPHASDVRFTTFWTYDDGAWRRVGFQDAPVSD